MFYSRDFPEYSESTDKPNNRLARIHNTLASAMSRRAMLPKIIVFILEDDIINYLGYNDYGVSEMFGRMLEYLLNEVQKSILRFRSKFLVPKVFKKDWPKVVWLLPSFHNNYTNSTLRRKYSTELAVQVQNRDDNMALRFKQCWSTDNNALVKNNGSNELTPAGIRCFWHAVDRTVKFADHKFSNKRCTSNMQRTTASQSHSRMTKDSTVFSSIFKKH